VHSPPVQANKLALGLYSCPYSKNYAAGRCTRGYCWRGAISGPVRGVACQGSADLAPVVTLVITDPTMAKTIRYYSNFFVMSAQLPEVGRSLKQHCTTGGVARGT
jgi:hypothetical protein